MFRLASLSSWLVLMFTGVGACSGESDAPAIERPETTGARTASPSFAVFLSEVIPVPIDKLSEQVILAGPQHFLIVDLDSEGERLREEGFLDLRLSPGLALCDPPLDAIELHCLASDDSGSHILEVRVGDEHLVLPFRTVAPGEVVEVELLHPDEEELSRGTWVQVDVVGVTEDGTHVGSVHPRFESEDGSYVGYFAYRYDPDAPARTLQVEALDRRIQTTFRGAPSEETAANKRNRPAW